MYTYIQPTIWFPRMWSIVSNGSHLELHEQHWLTFGKITPKEIAHKQYWVGLDTRYVWFMSWDLEQGVDLVGLVMRPFKKSAATITNKTTFRCSSRPIIAHIIDLIHCRALDMTSWNALLAGQIIKVKSPVKVSCAFMSRRKGKNVGSYPRSIAAYAWVSKFWLLLCHRLPSIHQIDPWSPFPLTSIDWLRPADITKLEVPASCISQCFLY